MPSYHGYAAKNKKTNEGCVMVAVSLRHKILTSDGRKLHEEGTQAEGRRQSMGLVGMDG
jgi:hypothetical protein